MRLLVVVTKSNRRFSMTLAMLGHAERAYCRARDETPAPHAMTERAREKVRTTFFSARSLISPR